MNETKNLHYMDKRSAKKVMNLIIVDESGSMSIIRDQALAGLNETINTCKKLQENLPGLEQRVTLVSFSSGRYCVHYDNLNVAETTPLTAEDYCPRGGTPLYDAIGKSFARVNASTEVDDNVLVTIITDGEENCSEEYTLKMVKNLINKQKEQGWTITLIGTDDLDVESMAGSMGIDHKMSFCEDAVHTEAMFAKEREARVCYCLAVESNPERKIKMTEDYFGKTLNDEAE